MTSEETELKRIEVLKQINEKRDTVNIVAIERHSKKTELFNAKKQVQQLEQDISNLTETVRIGKETIARLKTEEEILRSEYWRSK